MVSTVSVPDHSVSFHLFCIVANSIFTQKNLGMEGPAEKAISFNCVVSPD